MLLVAAAGIRNLEMHLREFKSVGLWRAEVGSPCGKAWLTIRLQHLHRQSGGAQCWQEAGEHH